VEQHFIDIEIRPGGEVKVHVKGAKGSQCMAVRRPVQEARRRGQKHRANA